ncbi:MAG: glycosyltransferase family 2 protein [Opitutus sp.]
MRRTLAALAANDLARETDLIVFSDGPRTPLDAPAVAEVRAELTAIDGFQSVQIMSRERNLGLAGSIIEGVTKICSEYGRVIVLEDDLITSSGFLTYMNEALALYEPFDEVASIHGYVYPSNRARPETFLLRGADCWGWATWARAWKGFNPDGAALLRQLNERNLLLAFDYDGAAPYSEMLRAQIEGRNNSWAIRWHASAFLAGKFTLYPGRTLVQNIGLAEGTHFADSDFPDAPASNTSVAVRLLPREENQECRAEFERFFRDRRKLSLKKIVRRVRDTVHRWRYGRS